MPTDVFRKRAPRYTLERSRGHAASFLPRPRDRAVCDVAFHFRRPCYYVPRSRTSRYFADCGETTLIR